MHRFSIIHILVRERGVKRTKVSIFGLWDQNSSFLEAQAAPALEPTTCRISCHHTSFTCFHWTTPLPPPLSARPRLLGNSQKQQHFSCSFWPRVSCRQSESWPFGPRRCYDFLLTAQLLQLCTNTRASLVSLLQVSAALEKANVMNWLLFKEKFRFEGNTV